MWPWYSTVSTIARSAWRSARSDAGGSRQGPGQRLDEERVGLFVQGEPAALARPAHHAAGRARERGQVVGLAAGRARAQVRRQAGRDQELEPERELVGGAATGRVGVQQRELVGQQVVGRRVGIALLEQPCHRVARARRRVQRPAVVAQPGMAAAVSALVTVSMSPRPS